MTAPIGSVPSTLSPQVTEKRIESPRRRRPEARQDVDPRIMKAAKGMEGMFIDHMMQVMRKTVPTNPNSLENPATKIYRSMLDSEYSQQAVDGGGFGLAEQIVEHLAPTRYNKRVTGGEKPE